jgi:hypothetical protein
MNVRRTTNARSQKKNCTINIKEIINGRDVRNKKKVDGSKEDERIN